MMGTPVNFVLQGKVINSMQANSEKQLIKAYKKSLKTVRSDLAEVYAKYSVKGKLTYAEMAKYGRLDALQKELRSKMMSVTGYATRETAALQKTLYMESYYRTAFTIEKAAQSKLSYGLLNKNVINRAIENPLVHLSERGLRDKLLIGINQKVTQGLIQGQSYPEMAKGVKKVINETANSSVRIARTEGHRVQQAGRLDSGHHAADVGVKMVKVWDAALDSVTRDAHAELDGTKVGMDEDFISSAGGKGQGPGQMGEAADDINCFPTETFVFSPSKIKRGYKRFYEGKLINITTTTGIKLSGTSNHPVLTDQGWVALNQIKIGTNIVCASFVKDSGSIDPDIKNRPSMISEIFDFLSIGNPGQRTSGITKQFHGDGFDSDVYIKTIECQLLDRVKAFFLKPFKKNILSLPFKRFRFLASESSFYTSGFWLRRAFKRFIGLSSKLFSIIVRKITHAGEHGTASVPNGDVGLSKKPIDNASRNIEFARKHLCGKSGKVFFDKIVGIDISNFSGHVYNLQTKNGIYVAMNNLSHNGDNINGIVVHNCRCSIRYEIEGFEPKFRRVRGEGVVPYKKYKEWAKAKDIK